MALTTLSSSSWKAGGFPLGQHKHYPGGAPPAAELDAHEHHSANYTQLAPGVYTSLPAAPIKPSNPWVARRTALAYVNTARAALGYPVLTKLPQGQPGSGSSCVLARALPHCIGVAGAITFASYEATAIVAKVWATTNVSGNAIAVPAALAEFIWHFDNRHYSDLIA